MRLRQLARKINKNPLQIISFLSEKGIPIENDDNTKVEDEHTMLVINHFAPELMNDNLDEIPDEPRIPEAISESPLLAEPVSPGIPSVEEPAPELIKAPKIELSGLKVLGKIELPEPKKKEMAVENKEAPRPRIEKQESRHRNEQREQRQRYPQKNPVALQREKELREEQQKRDEERRRQKEMKVLHYEKKMNARKSIKPMKSLHHEELHSEEPEPSIVPQPQTIWGKFMRWLNT